MRQYKFEAAQEVIISDDLSRTKKHFNLDPYGHMIEMRGKRYKLLSTSEGEVPSARIKYRTNDIYTFCQCDLIPINKFEKEDEQLLNQLKENPIFFNPNELSI